MLVKNTEIRLLCMESVRCSVVRALRKRPPESAPSNNDPEEALLARLPLRSPSDFGLVFTSSVQGSIKPCGCTARPLGGVARLGTAIARLRAHYGENLLFVDAGDLLFEKKSPRPAVEKCQDDARIEVLLSSYKSFGVVQTVKGERDAANGADAYQTWLEDHQIHHGDAAIATTLQRVGAREIGLVSVRAEGEWAEQKIKLSGDASYEAPKSGAHGGAFAVVFGATSRDSMAGLGGHRDLARPRPWRGAEKTVGLG